MRVVHIEDGVLLSRDDARMHTEARERLRVIVRAEERRLDTQRRATSARQRTSDVALSKARQTETSGPRSSAAAATARRCAADRQEEVLREERDAASTSDVLSRRDGTPSLVERSEAPCGRNVADASWDVSADASVDVGDTGGFTERRLAERDEVQSTEETWPVTEACIPDHARANDTVVERVRVQEERRSGEDNVGLVAGSGHVESRARAPASAHDRRDVVAAHAVVFTEASERQRWSIDVTLDNGMRLAFSKSAGDGVEGRARLHGPMRLSSESRLVLQTRLQAHGFRLEFDANRPSAAGKDRGGAA